VPAPKATQQPQQQQQPQQEQQPQQRPSNEDTELPKGGVILPPEGTLLPRNTPEGSETKPKPTKPSSGDELPGLPPETEPLPPIKPPDATPPKAPSKPAAEKPKKNSRSEDEAKPRQSLEARVVVPAQPENSQLARPWALQENGQPTASAATPSSARGARADTVVAWAGGMEPERNTSLPGVSRADSIRVTPDSSADRVEPAAYAIAESPAKQEAVARVGLPSVALGGYCPVELSRNGRWALGDLRWTVVYQGWIYRLSGAEQRQQFLADPGRFAPVNSCNDVVLSVNDHRNVPGQPAYCATYNNRLYMFSSAATQAEFNKNPERYAAKR
jgi:YHS domain-containing protein